MRQNILIGQVNNDRQTAIMETGEIIGWNGEEGDLQLGRGTPAQ